MTILDILHYPDPRLRTKAQPVTQFGPALVRFADDLLETMYDAPGIGLAATQVDVHQRIIAVDISEDREGAHVLVNPVLTLQGELVETDEGCLSIPGFYEPVSRAQRITVNARSASGEKIEFEATDLLAVCIQHECDHLEGKLFVDYLSNMKRNRIRKKLLKLQKQSA